VIHCPAPASEINDLLLDHDILGGYDLSQDYPDLVNHILIAVTEMNACEQIDRLVEVLAEVNHG
jgi:glycine dehydrogenase subunit 1